MPSAPDGVREAVAGYIKWMDKRGMLGKVTSEQMFGNVEAKRREEEKRIAREAINKARKEGQIVNKRERFAKEVADKIKALIAKRNELPLRSQERAEVDAQIEAIRNEPFKGNKEKTAYYNANRDILDPMVDEALKVEEKPKEEPKEEPTPTEQGKPIAEDFKEDYNSGKLNKGDFGGSRNLGVFEYKGKIVKVVKSKRKISPEQMQSMRERLGDMDNVYFVDENYIQVARICFVTLLTRCHL
jgi:hypothetical protein